MKEKLLSFRKEIQGRVRAFFYSLRHNQLVKSVLAILFFVLMAAAVFSFLEGSSPSLFTNLGRGLWWAVVTVTTVGYGDVVPDSTAGRMIGAVVMLSGVALVSIFTAAISSMVITRKLREGRGLTKIKAKHHIVILGWNQFAEDVIRNIMEDAIRDNRTVVLINQMKADAIEPVLTKFRRLQLKFVSGDFTDEMVLNQANMAYAHAAIILPDESIPGALRPDERTILACLTVKSIEPKVKVVAHLLDRANESHLRRANADQIVVSNRYSGYLLAKHVVAPGIPETIDALLTTTHNIRLAKQKIPRSFLHRDFGELCTYFKGQHNSLVVGILREEAGFELADILSEDYSAIDAFIKNKLENAGKGLARKPKVEVILNPPLDYQVTEKDAALVIEKVS